MKVQVINIPIYEYLCDCGLMYEEFHEMGCYDSVCPSCGKPTQKLMSPAYSNFTAWSDTIDKLGKWSTQHEDFTE